MDSQIKIPKVSILLATYNGEKFIKKSIDSVLSQTFKKFELLIGFNGTTDDSKDIVNSYNDERIRVFDYGDDKGKSKTLNKLLKEARADWLAIQDDDDMWMGNKLEEQILFCKDFDIIGSQIRYVDENDALTGTILSLAKDHNDILFRALNGDNHIANTSAVFKKDKTVQVGGWDESIIGVEDFDFWLKMIKVADCKVTNLDNILVHHRVHSNSNFNTKVWNVDEILKKYK